jgi:hypothetical protein
LDIVAVNEYLQEAVTVEMLLATTSFSLARTALVIAGPGGDTVVIPPS